MNTSMSTALVALGDALERAARVDLQSHRPRRAPRLWRSRRLLVLLAGLVVLVPGGALAATELFSDSQVAASLPRGTLALGGTDPICTTVTPNVEYHCTLTKPPSNAGAPDAPGSPRLMWVRIGGRVVIIKAGEQLVQPAQLLVKTTPAASVPPAATQTDWLGTVEATVDASKHVNGGCRSLNAAGTDWECYIGEAAVRQQIISQGFLGQYAPTPGVG